MRVKPERKIVLELHIKLFPEEYDFLKDNDVEFEKRNNGKNPKSEEYIKEVNERRIKNGFLPMDQSGYAVDDSTKEYCEKIIANEGNPISLP